MTFTNNIVDSGTGASNLAFNIGAGLPSPFTGGAYPNLTMNKNLTISDTTSAYGNGTFNGVAYASVGFSNYQGNTVIPLSPSNWDVVTGTYATASTTGTPLGATFADTLAITTTSLPGAAVGSAYNFTVAASGGYPPYAWSATGLPAGLSIAPSSGAITGTPTTAGTDSVVLTVRDLVGNPISKTLSLTVSAASTLSFPLLGGYLIGSQLQTSLGTTAYQQQVATLGAAVLGTYPGWSSGGYNNQTAAAAIKAINPNIKLTEYVNHDAGECQFGVVRAIQHLQLQ